MRVIEPWLGAMLLFGTMGCGTTSEALSPRANGHHVYYRSAGGEPAGVVVGTEVPTGTRFLAQFDVGLDATTAARGDRFTASVLSPVVDDGGSDVIPPSARVVGHVAARTLQRGPREPATLTLALDGMFVGETWIPLHASILALDVSSAGTFATGPSRPLTEALIGGHVEAWQGTTAGANATRFSGNGDVRIPAGSQFLVRFDRAVSVATLRGSAPPMAIGGGPWK